MKTKISGAIFTAVAMAMGTTMMAQDTTKTKMQTDTLSQMRQEVPQMMEAMDGDGDGMVSMEEAKAGNDQMLYKGFEAADTSGDGMIDTEEFMAYQKMGKEVPSMKETDTIIIADTISGMKGESSEMMDPMDGSSGAIEEMGDTSDQTMRSSFEMADTSGDGMIDMEEFIVYEGKMKDGSTMAGEKMGTMKKMDSIDN